MYEHHHSQFGKNTRHVLENPKTGNGFVFSPTAGGLVMQIKFGGQPLLDGYDTPETLEELAWKKSILLYPFPNRLDGGKYSWLGKEYFFPQNNADNAIHGFAFARKFEIVRLTTAENFAEVNLRLDDAGENPSFPFASRLEVAYKITDSGQFLVNFKVKNLGKTSLPFGLGWHPYFRLSPNVADTDLQMSPAVKIEVNERMLPTGKISEFKNFEKRRAIASEILDNCFKIKNLDKKWAVEIFSGGKKLSVWAAGKKWPFVQIFTPPHRTSVAIEPMTCNVDAFNNGEGLIDLAAGKTWSGGFGLSFR